MLSPYGGFSFLVFTATFFSRLLRQQQQQQQMSMMQMMLNPIEPAKTSQIQVAISQGSSSFCTPRIGSIFYPFALTPQVKVPVFSANRSFSTQEKSYLTTPKLLSVLSWSFIHVPAKPKNMYASLLKSKF